MSKIQQEIQNHVDHIAQNAIDIHGIEFASFDINLPRDHLCKLIALLIAESDEGYLFLSEYAEYNEALESSLKGNLDAEKCLCLCEVLEDICLMRFEPQMRRLIDYRISELRQSYFDEMGCVARIDPETGETIWSKM